MSKLHKPFQRTITIAVTLAGALLFGTTPSLGRETVKEVHFKKGAISTTLSGLLKGYDTVTYKLAAKAGQAMSILFSPKNSACYFNVMAPGAKEAAHIGSTAGNEYAANLTATGEYDAQVYLMRSSARRNEVCKFSITFEVSGAGSDQSAAVPGTEERDMVTACANKAVSFYAVALEVVRFDQEGRPTKMNSGFVMTGEADKGVEGKKQFRCSFNGRRKLTDLMPLNSDGE